MVKILLCALRPNFTIIAYYIYLIQVVIIITCEITIPSFSHVRNHNSAVYRHVAATTLIQMERTTVAKHILSPFLRRGGEEIAAIQNSNNAKLNPVAV